MDHFEQEIRPVLIAECISCHGARKQEGGLRLDSRQALLAGGESGGLGIGTDENLLLEAIHYESYEMPPTGKLDSRTIEQFEIWMAHGAPWPEQSGPLREEETQVTEEDRQWWAFQPFRGAEPPALPESDSGNPIDSFVLAKLGEQGLQPAPPASKIALVRRLYLDLLGLPPTPAEVERYLEDESPLAWEHLVDRLLDDPRYGEHWARFWLDIVRYAESDGWNQDAYRPHIWRYRDYVVESFNADKPYAEFVREQLAGDEIGQDDPDHLVATGFLRLGIYEYNQRDARGHWNDIMNETTDVVGDVFFGMSIACARCHNHKFDPIPQRDYFKLRAFFEPISWRDDLVAATQTQQLAYETMLREWQDASRQVQHQIDQLLEPYYARKWESTVDKFPVDIQACFHMPVENRTSWQNQMAYLVERQFMEEGGGPLKSMSKADKAKYEELQKQLAEFEKLKPQPLPAMMSATDFAGLTSPTLIQDSGEKEPVPPGYLTVLPDLDSGHVRRPQHLERFSTGRRSALAEWIGDPENPLTNRVIVNRIWQRHFGQGIVETTSDFGTQGGRPSHPKLLDWLTEQFVDGGGRIKPLHKLIVTSATWKQSATHPQALEYEAKDPAELLLWRARVRRLTAEQIRDAMLSASGELDPRIGGPSVEEKTPRRGLYIKSYRNRNDNFLHGFDMANGLKSVPIRDRTTTATQALLLFNGEYALGRAQHMAKRLMAQVSDPHEIVRQAFLVAWNREPTSAEYDATLGYLDLDLGEDARPLRQEEVVDLCHILFNANQFLYCE